jgi:hypothetical protein
MSYLLQQIYGRTIKREGSKYGMVWAFSNNDVEFLGYQLPLSLPPSKDASELRETFEPLELEQKDLVLIPVNDNKNPLKVGGSHWYATRPSLLTPSGAFWSGQNLIRNFII